VGNGKVVTLAGLGTPEKPHPLQKAYVEEQVPQCGYLHQRLDHDGGARS
jgi:aerobic-type carbon monoxide dehydrogenase small subunit (CoxS/CutS family)